jgi:hypothetical protein
MHWRRDRLDGDEAAAFVGHSLGAPPGPGRGGGQAPRNEGMISYTGKRSLDGMHD